MTDHPEGQLAELQAENAKLIRWHREDGDALTKMRATIKRLRAEKRELEQQAAVQPPADRDLRDRIGEVIGLCLPTMPGLAAQIQADVLAVLPAPVDRAINEERP